MVCLSILLAVAPTSAKYVVTGEYADPSGFPIIQNGVMNYTYTADPDKAISIVQYSLPLNTRVDFTITYGLGNTKTGYMEYMAGTPPPIWQLVFDNSTSTVSLGTMTRTENFVDVQEASNFVKHIQFSAYGINDSATPPESGFTLYQQGYGLWSSEIVFTPIPDIQNNMISRIEITSTKPIDIVITVSKRSALAQTLEKSISQFVADSVGKMGSDALAFVNFAISIAGTILSLCIAVLYWIKFLFWDNLGLTIGIYLSISMAYAAATSKDIFMFFKKFFNDQKKFYDFMIGLWRVLIEILATFRGIFRI
jgi:hypothetical protein